MYIKKQSLMYMHMQQMSMYNEHKMRGKVQKLCSTQYMNKHTNDTCTLNYEYIQNQCFLIIQIPANSIHVPKIVCVPKYKIQSTCTSLIHCTHIYMQCTYACTKAQQIYLVVLYTYIYMHTSSTDIHVQYSCHFICTSQYPICCRVY